MKELATELTLQAAVRSSAAVWSLPTGSRTVRPSGMLTHASASVAPPAYSHVPSSGGDME